ncbi:MAG TPA: hypothetical protein VGM30_20060 [Puia sp.]|jgi:hypothetical protein
MQALPFYIYLTFGFTAIASIWAIYKAANSSKVFLLLISLWVILQSILGLTGFYRVTTLPPRFVFLLLPPLLFLLIGLAVPGGRRFIDGLNIKILTLFSLMRIPVEIVLFWLFLHKAIPEAMTFEGRNFDILSGLSAPFIWYFGFAKGRMNKTLLMIWNIVCLGLILNVVTIAVLFVTGRSAPSGVDPSGIAMVYFPFLLLPSCLVPLVLLSHVSAIRQLLKKTP